MQSLAMGKSRTDARDRVVGAGGVGSAYGRRAGKRARSSPAKPCTANVYPRRWESQTIFSRGLTSPALHFGKVNEKEKQEEEEKQQVEKGD